MIRYHFFEHGQAPYLPNLAHVVGMSPEGLREFIAGADSFPAQRTAARRAPHAVEDRNLGDAGPLADELAAVIRQLLEDASTE